MRYGGSTLHFSGPVWVPVAAPAIAPSKPGGAAGLFPSARLLPDPHLCLLLDLDLDHEPVLCSTCHVLVQRPTAGGDAAAEGMWQQEGCGGSSTWRTQRVSAQPS